MCSLESHPLQKSIQMCLLLAIESKDIWVWNRLGLLCMDQWKLGDWWDCHPWASRTGLCLQLSIARPLHHCRSQGFNPVFFGWNTFFRCSSCFQMSICLILGIMYTESAHSSILCLFRFWLCSLIKQLVPLACVTLLLFSSFQVWACTGLNDSWMVLPPGSLPFQKCIQDLFWIARPSDLSIKSSSLFTSCCLVYNSRCILFGQQNSCCYYYVSFLPIFYLAIARTLFGRHLTSWYWLLSTNLNNPVCSIFVFLKKSRMALMLDGTLAAVACCQSGSLGLTCCCPRCAFHIHPFVESCFWSTYMVTSPGCCPRNSYGATCSICRDGPQGLRHDITDGIVLLMIRQSHLY